MSGRRAADPRGDGRPAAALPAQPRSRPERSDDATISSERLAELAGVNAAKVRKDLSYLGLLRHPRRRLRRRVPAVPDQPRARPHPGLAGRHRRHRQPRPGPRQLRRLRRARLPVVALVDADPAKVGSERVGDRPIAPIDDLARLVRRARQSPSASSPRPPAAAQDVADRLVAAGVTSILNFAPGGASPCPTACRCARSTSPSSCRSSASTSSAATAATDVGDAPTGRRADELTSGRQPLDPSVRAWTARAWSVGGRHGSRPARSTALLDAGAVVHCRSPAEVDDRTSRHARGRGRPARASGRTRPATSPAYRLVVDRHRTIPRSTARCSDEPRRPGVWVNAADDPANCSFTLPARVRRGDLAGHHRHRRAQPGARRLAPRPARRRDRARVRDPARVCSPRPEPMLADGAFDRGSPIGSALLDSGMLELIRAGRPRPKQRSACRRVCRRRRTEPPHRAARAARADDGRRRRPAQGARTTSCAASTSPRPWCSRRATAPRSTPSPSASTARYADVRDFLAELAVRAGAEEFADHLYMHYDDGRGRATCSRWPPGSTRRSSARARSSARSRRVGARPAEGAAGPLLNLLFRHALEVGKRARTETGIVAAHRLGLVGRGGDGRRPPRLARRPARARARRRRDGRGHGGVARPRPASPTSSSPTAPGDRAEALAAPGRRHGRSALADLPPRWPRSTCCSPPPARRRCSSSTSTLAPVIDAARRSAAAHRRHRRAARRRPRRRRARRRDAARHRRPPALRRRRHRAPARRGRRPSG